MQLIEKLLRCYKNNYYQSIGWNIEMKNILTKIFDQKKLKFMLNKVL